MNLGYAWTSPDRSCAISKPRAPSTTPIRTCLRESKTTRASDAAFLAAIGGEEELLRGLAEAVDRPRFPLYLGRRSCPPVGPVSLGVHHGTLDDALTSWPWLAAEWYRRKAARRVRLEIIRDARPGEPVTETVPDEPVSFDPAHRQHTWRCVLRRHVDVTNDLTERAGVVEHDPLSLLGG